MVKYIERVHCFIAQVISRSLLSRPALKFLSPATSLPAAKPESPCLTARLKLLHERSVSNKSRNGRSSKSKKYKQNLPRPFSPIYTNINFYETYSR